MPRHDGRYRVLEDEWGGPTPPQQHAEIIEPGHDPLQLHAVDQEDRQRRLTFSYVIEEGVLQILRAFGCHCRCSVFIRGPLSRDSFFVTLISPRADVSPHADVAAILDVTPGNRASASLLG